MITREMVKKGFELEKKIQSKMNMQELRYLLLRC